MSERHQHAPKINSRPERVNTPPQNGDCQNMSCIRFATFAAAHVEIT